CVLISCDAAILLDSSTGHLWNSTLEDNLGTDYVLVDFLNEFLGLPTFAETIQFNAQSGAFEVVSDAEESVHSRIRVALREYEYKILTGSPWLTAVPMFDNSYTVLCLDREQGMQWVKKSRLPLFLQSDFYFEYRLVKLLSQLECPSLRVGDADSSSVSCTVYPHPPACCTPPHSLHKQGTLSFIREEEKEKPSDSTQQLLDGKGKPEDAMGVEADAAGAGGCLYMTESEEQEEEVVPCSCPSLPSPTGSTTATTDAMEGHLIDSLVQQVAVSELEAGSIVSAAVSSGNSPQAQQESGVIEEPMSPSEWARAEMDAFNYHCSPGKAKDKHSLEAFKGFLQGTPGEKVLRLWMDIERLRTLQNPQSKSRHLLKMRNQYMLSNGPQALSTELLSRLGLASATCWTDNKLLGVQAHLTEELLTYWGPLFCMVRSASDRGGLIEPQQQQRWQRPHHRPHHLHSSYDGDLHAHYISRPLPVWRSRPLSGNSTPGGLESMRMERMMQALRVEPRAGYYFTRFCELSGNKLWESAIHFWLDLQDYQETFHQAALDPYRAQKKAQVLYSTYLSSVSQQSIGVSEGCRRGVFARLTPPFEELFDGAEEHVLSLLLEPWTLLTSQDSHIYEQVELWEESRHVETEDYRQLQALHTDTAQRMEQLARERKTAPPPPEVPREPDLWTQVPEQFRGFRLLSVLRNRAELQHFQAFLEEHSASMDLLCWLDLEQLRRTSSHQRDQKLQLSRSIKTKYLNKKYFFGPSSPATKHQQEEIMRLAGGLGQLLQSGLSDAALTEMQNVVRGRLERKWLPVYLATPDFAERQKLQPQVQEQRRRYRRRKQKWKPPQHMEGSWMASSREMLAFRQALLNPVTCLQFQRFAGLKGELYENDVLFWLEVQRYKDLFHSHCEEATIQHKISTIISCFISSTVPPALQISIPPEQANTILDRRRELGPYVFREAQMSVFGELFKLWPQFLELKSSVGAEEDLLPLLEKKRRRQKEREMQRRREEEEEEERKAQEMLRAQQLEEAGSEGEELDEDGENRKVPQVEVLFHTDQLSWSYSKYMAALERESVLLHKQMMQEQACASFSTGRDSVSTASLRSEVLRRAPWPNSTSKTSIQPSDTTGC
ncbi:regulator of G-protein signaling 22, partial [Engraulis encrasicolus]|uniref:regulator of G-protein signaling 22 n=1 Tax=Engraulis encrasicolus TaxID=184585 RepID=UPI002FD61782